MSPLLLEVIKQRLAGHLSGRGRICTERENYATVRYEALPDSFIYKSHRKDRINLNVQQQGICYLRYFFGVLFSFQVRQILKTSETVMREKLVIGSY